MPLRYLCKCFWGRRKPFALRDESSTALAGPRIRHIGATLDEDSSEVPSSIARRILLSSAVEKGERIQLDTSSSFLHTITSLSIDAACCKFDEAIALIVFESSNRMEAEAGDSADGGRAHELQAARVNSDAFNFQVRAQPVGGIKRGSCADTGKS